MPSELKLNPYAALVVETEGEKDCILIAPKIGEGFQTLNIGRATYPALYEILVDLSASSLNLLDIENELDDEARDLFTRFGVLVTAESVPDKPLFSCLLDDIQPGDQSVDGMSLQVNPTFRFEPFDLANFRALSTEKHFSPYLPTAWIKSPAAQLDLGFWVSHESAAILSGLSAGGLVPDQIDPLLRAKLFAAEIFIEPEAFKENERVAAGKLAEAKELFAQKKYAVINNVIPDGHVRAMQAFYRAYIGQGFMWFGDTRVERRFRQGNEPLARFFHLSMTALMSKLVGQDLKPSYCYAASYREGADLKPHVDREACEYSFSIQIDYEPATEDTVSPWALYLATGKLGEDGKFELEDGTEKAIHLRNGDCLAYRGRDLVHYRETLPAGHKSTSLFFHYVPMEFDDSLI